jgi:hypothetical protein
MEEAMEATVNVVLTNEQGMVCKVNQYWEGETGNSLAEEMFKHRVKDYLELNVFDDEMDIFLEDGYACNELGQTVQLVHSEIDNILLLTKPPVPDTV